MSVLINFNSIAIDQNQLCLYNTSILQHQYCIAGMPVRKKSGGKIINEARETKKCADVISRKHIEYS